MSLFGLDVELSRLLGRHRGEPSRCGIDGAFAGTLLTLQRRYPSTNSASHRHPAVLVLPRPLIGPDSRGSVL
jgi:hypothetical protein